MQSYAFLITHANIQSKYLQKAREKRPEGLAAAAVLVLLAGTTGARIVAAGLFPDDDG